MLTRVSNVVRRINSKMIIKNFSSVDQSEMKHFSDIKDWWKNGSEMAPLYSYNFARVEMIRDFMKDFNSQKYSIQLPLQDLSVLDVGCGGGLLTESLCRLGGKVTGLDANENSISIAKEHKKSDESLDNRLQYKLGSAEELSKKGETYDIVTCMEVIEHISDKKEFLKTLSSLVRIGGMLFVSTMEKKNDSWVKLIVGAEYLLNLVPKGTHDWNKFIDAGDLIAILEENGFKVLRTQGFTYNILTGQMEKTQKETNYALAAIKLR